MHIAAPHTLQYRQPLKQDLRLLHVDEETLQQVLAGRWVELNNNTSCNTSRTT